MGVRDDGETTLFGDVDGPGTRFDGAIVDVLFIIEKEEDPDEMEKIEGSQETAEGEESSLEKCHQP